MSAHVSAQKRETVDKIVAVVGKEAITATELAAQIELVAFQTNKKPTSQDEIKQFQIEVLEQMISDKLFLLEAQKDTSISIRTEEIDKALEEQIARIAANYESNEAFISRLSQEGLTLRDLQKRYRADIENQLLRQRHIQKKLYSVSVSKHEVEEFYRQFEDSIPTQPEATKLSHILLQIRPAYSVEDSVKQLAMSLRERIIGGEDFAALAVQYASLGAGANGGDLGFVSRDDVVPEFSRAAFALNDGEISGAVRTQFGYHIIRLEGKRDDQARLRHILLAVVPSAQDTAATMALADSLIEEARSGTDFQELAKTFSTDDQSRAQGGELGWFATNQLPQDFVEPLQGWQTAGEIKGPILSQFGVHILKLLEYQSAKKLDLVGDFDQVKELARQDKTGKLVDKWIADIKDRTYIEYRLDS